MKNTSTSKPSAKDAKVAKESKIKKRKMKKDSQARATKKNHWCNACNEVIPSDQLKKHNQDEKHMIAINQLKKKKKSYNHQSSIVSQGVFIYGVADSTTDRSFVNYLSKYGQVMAFQRNRNCILVQFENRTACTAMVETKQHWLEGQTLKVIPRKFTNNSRKIHPKSTSDVLKQQLLNYKNLRLPLEKQLEAIMAALELSQKGVEQRKEIISKLESWLSISFPGCRLLPFGSSVSGLSYLNSDLDMYLELPSLIADDGKRETDWTACRDQCISVLNQANIVLRAHPEVGDMVFVRKARVPIIKFVHTPTGLSCDINCHSKLGVINSKLFRSLIAVDDVLFKPFFFFLKLWANSHYLIDSPNGGLSSYGLNLLALFFLQQLKLLPTVEELQKDVSVEVCRNWNANFSEPKPLDPNEKRPSLLELLTGFFHLYQSLDSAKVVISTFKGQLIPTADFSVSMKLRNSMPSYTENVYAGNLPPLKIREFNIQEPFELNLNVTGGFVYAERFKSLCRDAEHLCRQMTCTSPISFLLGDFKLPKYPSRVGAIVQQAQALSTVFPSKVDVVKYDYNRGSWSLHRTDP